ncbi:hypothetical protein [Qipengyuania sp. MTN3-11]|uniref:hypothetical protein n=1 Tax=Qipengyuania sp. MTN3-11 TaxID=3056557 RepID=UPI0036F30069
MKVKNLAPVWVGGLATIGALLSPTSAGAQDLLERYDLCAETADDAARLACFDRTYREERESRAARAEAERARLADRFGLSAIQIAEREEEALAEAEASTDPLRIAAAEQAAQQREEESEVVSEVTDVFTDESRRPVVLLSNGQVWRATSNRTLRGAPRAGWTATVRQTWSGGYRMTFEEKNGYLGVGRVR